MVKLDSKLFPNPDIRAISALFDFFIGTLLMVFLSMYLFKVFYINVGFSLVFIYFLIIPYLTNGQTLGQYIFRIKIVSLLSSEVSLLQIVARQLISWFGSNNFGKTNKNNQQLHDKLLYTTVIKKSKYGEFVSLNIKEKPIKRYKVLSNLLPILILIFYISNIMHIFLEGM
jgi:uncharacterized RDD family membrane protein YckC